MPYGSGECVAGQNTSVGSVDVSMVQSYGVTQQNYYHSEQVHLFLYILISSNKKIFILEVFLYCAAQCYFSLVYN